MAKTERKTEFYAELRRETELAVLVTDGVNEIWLPKSMIEIRPVKDMDVEITLPEWLAKKKEII